MQAVNGETEPWPALQLPHIAFPAAFLKVPAAQAVQPAPGAVHVPPYPTSHTENRFCQSEFVCVHHFFRPGAQTCTHSEKLRMQVSLPHVASPAVLVPPVPQAVQGPPATLYSLA